MKKIILVTGPDAEKRVDLVSRLYVEDPDDRRIIKTRLDLQRAMATGHTAVIATDPRILEARQDAMDADYPGVPVEVQHA
jgi:hypothetical protein